MKIEANKVVSLEYILRRDSHEGEIVEEVLENQPMEFIFGLGMMLPAFESNLNGLSANDTFQFKLNSDEAYGEFNEENIVELPKSNFEIDGEIEEGLLEVDNFITLQDQNENVFDGRVAEIREETVMIDFNHPMAGQALYFTGKVISVREATAEELSHGHLHDNDCGCGHDH